MFYDVGWLKERHAWPGLNGVVMVESKREIGGKIEPETRFWITSLALAALAVSPMIGDHWTVENGLHWVMDMVFRDECRVRRENAPATFTTLNHMAHNLTRRAPGNDSLRLRRKTAWDDDYLASRVAA